MSHLPEERANRCKRQVCCGFVVNSRDDVTLQDPRFRSWRSGLHGRHFESEKPRALGDYCNTALVFLFVILETVVGIENELLMSVIKNYCKAPQYSAPNRAGAIILEDRISPCMNECRDRSSNFVSTDYQIR